MSALTRRQALALSAAMAALPGLPGARADEPGMRLGDPRPFRPDMVVERARTLAAKPYTPPTQVPEAWRNLTYDQYRKIWFDTRNALWRGRGRPVQVEFFAPGLYFPAPIRVHAVEGGQMRPVLFDLAVFDTTDNLPDLPIDSTLGYSGLRLHGELETPGTFQEYAVFQGASYFRAIGQGQIYGLSARGIALNTGAPEGEEFPEFREFWIEAPAPGQSDVILHALLDGPSLTGAYRFRITPGATTTMDVTATLFPRVALENVGLAAETSMFFFDQTNRAGYEDFRPAVHDSGGLLIWNGAGERLWRPLANPAELQFSHFVDDAPKGFGLMQRARAFSDFADLSARYHQRPGLWVEPGENWGAGAVVLVEIPTDKEIYDNIVAYWRPRAPLQPGQAHEVSYRLHWCAEAPIPQDRAHVTNTHMGRSFSGRRIAAIDFAPHPKLPEDLSSVQVHTSANRGTVSEGILQRNPETGGVRLDFGFEPEEGRSMELRAQLRMEEATISEVWLYRWTPPA
ncbi:glucan biosynthesis protein [Oceanibium sediminis]|uniref:glucan biosynthesis protein n=1 Tax=Oceanibium sediminis TaxID=2026339 RepID=UPI000DD3AC24|nr:glucan biosynthesis protein G [Oceanibium sediminis]